MNFRSGCYSGIFSALPHRHDDLCHNVRRGPKKRPQKSETPESSEAVAGEEETGATDAFGGRESVCLV
jgi:hypothetical protein